jgi:restriction system protein
MARRKKQESLIDILVVLPSWVSIAFAAGGYISLRWIIPSLLPPAMKLLGPALASVAWLPLMLFGMVAFIAWARSFAQAHKSKPNQWPVSVKTSLTAALPTDRSIQNPANQWGNAVPSAVPAASQAGFHEWTLDALRAIEWKQFELLCGKYYEAAGFKIKTTPFGPDGGIDIKLFRADIDSPIALVQCKAWNGSQVGVATARELLGVMTSEKVSRGILVTTSTFSKDAVTFASANRIQLLDGIALVVRIRALPASAQEELLAFAFSGDYSTPSCPSCGIKMVMRKGKSNSFFGCVNYPRCRRTF